MRFDSYFELTKFIMGLRIIGYSTPFIDYKEDMNNQGILKHIHLLRVVMVPESKGITLEFYDNKTKVYEILLKKV